MEHRCGRAPTDKEVAAELGIDLVEYHDVLAEVSLARLSAVEDVDGVSGDTEPESEVTESLVPLRYPTLLQRCRKKSSS